MMTLDVDTTSHPLVHSEFLLKLRNLYSAENYCLRRIPGLLKKIPDNRLHQLLTEHLPLIVERMRRLEKIFDEINVKTGGAVCRTFKSLISKAGNSIYKIKLKHNHNTSELLSTLIEISIYRCSIYNFLKDWISANVPKPILIHALGMCLIEEDRFFRSLLRIRKNLLTGEVNFGSSMLQPAWLPQLEIFNKAIIRRSSVAVVPNWQLKLFGIALAEYQQNKISPYYARKRHNFNSYGKHFSHY